MKLKMNTATEPTSMLPVIGENEALIAPAPPFKELRRTGHTLGSHLSMRDPIDGGRVLSPKRSALFSSTDDLTRLAYSD